MNTIERLQNTATKLQEIGGRQPGLPGPERQPDESTASGTPGPAPPTATPPVPEPAGEQPASLSSPKRRRIAATIIAVIIIGGLLLGFLSRWRQRRTAAADMNQLAIPSVSVVSP